MTIKVVVGGPRGKMGSEAVKMIKEQTNLELVGLIDKIEDENNDFEVPVFLDAKTCFSKVDADVYVDLTVPHVGFNHTKEALKNHVNAVVGTSGFSESELAELTDLASTNKTGCVIAPNFAVGAVLMMMFSKMAAKYFPDVEIIEKHHDNKVDAPSGTAMKTVEVIKEERVQKEQGHPDEVEMIKGARGANIDGIHVHSVRLPGLVAHQEVIFGSKSQLLTIKHDSFHRESFMDGLKLAIEKSVDMEHLVYGLEHVMDLD